MENLPDLYLTFTFTFTLSDRALNPLLLTFDVCEIL